MNITRHNYEEFFILYMDNELSRDDRSRVELFVQQNPDLREELQTLQQMKLAADTNIIYKGKQSLMRSAAGCDISLDNYEEWLLSYVDDELTTEQEIAVENFAIANPAVKTELDILQKTKLQPEENIIFFNKDSLYRREEKTRRVVPIRWWRIAAAAALLFAISITGFFLLNKKPAPDQPPVAGVTDNKKAATKEPAIVKENTENKQAPLIPDNRNTETITNETKQNVPKNQLAKTVVPKKSSVKLPEETKKEDVLLAENDKNKNNLPEPRYNPNMKELPENTFAELTHQKEINPRSLVTNNDRPSFEFTRNNLQPENDAADEAQASGKKTMFRGLLRKITRTIEKTTNIKATDDEDRLLVGGLAIRL